MTLTFSYDRLSCSGDTPFLGMSMGTSFEGMEMVSLSLGDSALRDFVFDLSDFLLELGFDFRVRSIGMADGLLQFYRSSVFVSIWSEGSSGTACGCRYVLLTMLWATRRTSVVASLGLPSTAICRSLAAISRER